MITVCLWKCLLIVILLVLSDIVDSGTTEIEDHLETEIDFRHPSDFKELKFNMLSVRQPGFKEMKYNDTASGSITSGPVANWELFAFRYWYETRTKTAMCPVPPAGIATYCDWALTVPCLYAKDPFTSPRTIFVHTYMLPHFVESTLYFMDHSYRFVLVSGGSDATIPRSLDPRFKTLRGFANSPDGGSYYGRILNDERIIHWFAENHDMTHPKLSTLPTGMAYDGVHNVDDMSDHPNRTEVVPIEKRPLQFLMSDRLRGGSSIWNDRWNMVSMCENNRTFCFRPQEGEIAHRDFLKLMVSVPFVACVHGGGIDPSPKAWEALLMGTIPIIQHTSLDDGYEKFPVMFVNQWTELFDNNTESLLRSWLVKLAPYYEEGSEHRKHVLEKLTSSYWVKQFHHRYRAYEEALHNASVSHRNGSSAAAEHRLQR